MKVKATLTAVLEYEIDSLGWTSDHKNKALAEEKENFELNPAGFVTLPGTKIQTEVEKVKE